MPASGAAATTGVATAAVLLVSDILGHYNINLSHEDIGYAVLLVNSFAHYVKPCIAALFTKACPNVSR